MLDATFCGVFPGNGWGHIETPIALGCIPVVVQDAILTPWENVLDFHAYAVRIARKDLPRLPDILRAIAPERIEQMRRAMDRVWERFTYSSLVLAEHRRRCAHGSRQRGKRALCTRLEIEMGVDADDAKGAPGARVTGHDAIDTLMHVLRARLLASEGGSPAPALTG
jgi:hypothetical protein